jgi:hypothetical protein
MGWECARGGPGLDLCVVWTGSESGPGPAGVGLGVGDVEPGEVETADEGPEDDGDAKFGLGAGAGGSRCGMSATSMIAPPTKMTGSTASNTRERPDRVPGGGRWK